MLNNQHRKILESSDPPKALYAYAYQLFQAEQFDEAAVVYLSLMMMSPTDERHPRGLAACFHQKKLHLQALANYRICHQLTPNDPIPFYHATDCFLKLDDKPSAIRMLQEVIKKSDAPEYATLKEKAAEILQQLESNQ